MASKAVLVKTNERPNNRLECSICKERFWLRCKYDEHIAIHEHSKVSCNICSKSFYDQKLLDEHYITHTSVIKTYDCKECARKFLHKYQLEQHKHFHSPVEFQKITVVKKKSVHFNRVAHIKNIVDDTSDSEEFYSSDSDDEEECNSSDSEDYLQGILPKNEIVKTRSGRMVKRKKLFDEEETEVKSKSPKIEQTTITDYKSQRNKSSKLSNMDSMQKTSCKTKQAYSRKHIITEYNSQEKESSKISDIDKIHKKIINKELSVVVEKMPDDIYAKYLTMGTEYTKKQTNSDSRQESPKVIASSLAEKHNSSNGVSSNSIKGKKPKITVSSFYKYKLNQSLKNVQESPKVMDSNLSSKSTNKNNNTPSCSKTVQIGKSSGNSKVPSVNAKTLFKGTNNTDKPILSTMDNVVSQASVNCKSSTCKEYMYVGTNPDFRKIKQAIDEISTMSNLETFAYNNNSQKQFETKGLTITALNSPNSNTSGKNSVQLSKNTKSNQLDRNNSVSPIKLQNVNQLNESIPNEEGILAKKVVGEITVVKVTPEYMKIMQRDPLKQSVPSIQNLQSPNKKMTETVTVSHLTSNLNKSSTTISKSHDRKSIAAAKEVSKCLQSPNKQSTVIPSASASPAVLNSNKTLTLPVEKYFGSISNKSPTSFTKKIKESQKSIAVANNTLLETKSINNATKTYQRNSIKSPTIASPSGSLKHAQIVTVHCVQSSNKQLTGIASGNAPHVVSSKSLALSPGKHLASNVVKETSTAFVEKLKECHKLNTVCKTNTIAKTFRRSSVEVPIVQSPSSSMELNQSIPQVMTMHCPQSPNKQATVTTSPNVSPAVSNSNKSQTLFAGIHGSPSIITSIEFNKINNPKPVYQSNLTQSPVYQNNLTQSPVYQSNLTQSPVHSPIFLVHAKTPTIQNPPVSLAQMEIPTIQSPAVTLMFTTAQTIQSPTISVVNSKIQKPQTTKFPLKKIDPPGSALHVKKNLVSSKGRKITRKSFFEEPFVVADSPFKINKNKNLKTYKKLTVKTPVICNKIDENTQISSQSNLNKLQVKKNEENSIAEFEKGHKNELDNNLKLYDGNFEHNFIEDAVSSNNLKLCPSNLIEEILLTHNGKEISTQDTLSEQQTGHITMEMFDYSKAKHVERNQKNNYSDECKNGLVEIVLPMHKINEFEISPKKNNLAITADRKEIAKQSNEIADIINNSFEVNDNNLETREQNSVEVAVITLDENDDVTVITLDESDESIQISPQSNRKLTIIADKEEITEESLDIAAVINNLFEVNDNLTCQLNSVETTLIALDENDENIQVLPQSNINDLFVGETVITQDGNDETMQVLSSQNNNDLIALNIAKKPTAGYRTKSVETDVKKRLRSHANKRGNNDIKKANTSKKKQISLKNKHASSSKAGKKQTVKQSRTKHSKINKNKSTDLKNHSNSSSNISHNTNTVSKKTLPESNKSSKNLHEKLLQRYQAKLEEKERKKKEKFEFKKKMKYIEKLLASPSRDYSDEGSFMKGMLPFSGISIDDIIKMSGKCVTGTKEKTHVLQLTENILTMPCSSNSKVSSDSTFAGIGKDSQEKKELKNSKQIEEAQAIAKARSINLKFNKDLSEIESLQLLKELDDLIDTYNLGYDKCPFMNKTIRFCSLYVDSYKVRQKAISLGTKLNKMKLS